MAERPELLALATNIVSAHVSYNAVAADQLPGLIQQVFNALATAEQAVRCFVGEHDGLLTTGQAKRDTMSGGRN